MELQGFSPEKDENTDQPEPYNKAYAFVKGASLPITAVSAATIVCSYTIAVPLLGLALLASPSAAIETLSSSPPYSGNVDMVTELAKIGGGLLGAGTAAAVAFVLTFPNTDRLTDENMNSYTSGLMTSIGTLFGAVALGLAMPTAEANDNSSILPFNEQAAYICEAERQNQTIESFDKAFQVPQAAMRSNQAQLNYN